jgi:beta propeller repeat protein
MEASMKSKWIVIALGLCAAACARKVAVDDGTNSTVSGPKGSGASSGGAAGSQSSAGHAGSGSAANKGHSGSTVDAGSGSGGASTPVTGPSAQSILMSGLDQAKAGASSTIEHIQVLLDSLTNTDVPAVGSNGVSIMQYPASNEAAVLHVDWSRATHWFYKTDRAYHVYTAASADRNISLLYTMSSYGIYQDGSAAELSGMPMVYKEFLSASDQGYAWVDYANGTPGKMPNVFGVQTYGAIVFQTWAGDRSMLTDDQRYRARIDLSQKHVAFVEYASTDPGGVGQVMVQPLDGGAAVVAAPSSNHQDRPAIDGDWVVWEEYLSDTDSVIRARNLATDEVRDVSANKGFRTNPDLLGTLVVWEDQRGGDGDIYYADLAGSDGEKVAVSGPGHSTGARLTSDGLVWIEISGDTMGLLLASWIKS